MKGIFNNTILVILVLLLARESYGQTNAPKYSNEFLAIGIGAKNFGMGNSVISSVDDVTAGYYNPAGLLKIKKNIKKLI